MKSFALVNGQFQIDGKNDIVMISGDDELVQSVGIILATNKGEWFLNTEFGLDRFSILGQKLERERIESKITASILNNEKRVSSVDDVSISYDSEARKAEITFTFTKLDGTQLTGSVGV